MALSSRNRSILPPVACRRVSVSKMKWPKHAAFDDQGNLYVALKDCILKLVPEPTAGVKTERKQD